MNASAIKHGGSVLFSLKYGSSVLRNCAHFDSFFIIAADCYMLVYDYVLALLAQANL